MHVDAAGCNFYIKDLGVNNILIPSASQDITTANVFKVLNAKLWEMNKFTLQDLESS